MNNTNDEELEKKLAQLSNKEKEDLMMEISENIIKSTLEECYDLLDPDQTRELDQILKDKKSFDDILKYLSEEVEDFGLIFEKNRLKIRDLYRKMI